MTNAVATNARSRSGQGWRACRAPAATASRRRSGVPSPWSWGRRSHIEPSNGSASSKSGFTRMTVGVLVRWGLT